MNYTFPTISHIDQVLPFVEGRKDFVVANQKQGFTTVNYLINLPDSFDCYVRRECRGIKFNTKTGKILQRPFHKFFNVGEKEETQPDRLNLQNSFFEVYEKLDGSMIAPIILPDTDILRLTTKMGINEISMQAETYLAGKPELESFMYAMLKLGHTPIFEWCSLKNRIVLPYDSDQLVLLAVRDTITGEYFNLSAIALPNFIKTPVEASMDEIEGVKNLEGKEGFVLVLDGGHRIKVKSDWYVKLHKVKSEIALEHNLVQNILAQNLDDLIPLMDKETQTKVIEYRKKFQQMLQHTVEVLEDTFSNLQETCEDRKEFAEKVLKFSPRKLQCALFKMLDNPNTTAILLSIIYRESQKKQKWIDLKKELEFDFKWTGGMFSG